METSMPQGMADLWKGLARSWPMGCLLTLTLASAPTWASNPFADRRAASPAAPAMALGAADGYLAAKGPSPLRFQSTPPLTSVWSNSLPATPVSPLSGPTEPNPPELGPSLVSSAVAAEPVGDDLSPAPDEIMRNLLGIPETEETAAITPAPALAEPVLSYSPAAPGVVQPISPQAFLEFFRPAEGGTNLVKPGVWMPVQFNPPAPMARSSRATYHSQPAVSP
jgi:hypothetical protein